MQKKILIVNDGFPPHGWGGANTIAFLHAKELVALGYEVRVFTTIQENSLAGESTYEDIPVRTVYTNYHPRWWAYKSLHNTEALKPFAEELKNFKPDIVHFHNIHHYVSYRAIALAKRNGARTFLTTHDVMSFAYQKLHNFINYSSKEIPHVFNYHVPWQVNLIDARLRFNPFRNFIIRRYLKKVDQIFAVSGALKQALNNNDILGNVSVVHNGIDASIFGQYFDQEALRESLKLVDRKVILFVGRFTPDKGRDVTLRALAQVIPGAPNARLLVVGFDPKRQPEPAMERLIDELGVRDALVFVPALPYVDMFKYYRIADIMVVPSIIFDSFPTANLEAMAAGKPVIATCFGGSREAVEDGITGYIVNPLNINVVATKILELLTNPTRAETMGRAGHAKVEHDLSLAKQIDSYLAEYRADTF